MALPLRATRRSRFRSRSWHADACPLGHPIGIEELHSKVEAAHRSIFLNVPEQFILGPFGLLVSKGSAGLSGKGAAEYLTTSFGP
jgi:hypothetical protein